MIDVPCIQSLDRSNLISIQAGFAHAPVLTLFQAWRREQEDDFLPAQVRLGWCDSRLLILAELQDRDIYNPARKLNEKTWLLGDVFEAFLKGHDQRDYVEIHVTPENQRLQIHFPGGERDKPILLDNPDILYSKTWITSGADCWHVFAEIPALLVEACSEQLLGRRWQYSFSRYDYSRNRELPVLSSTSPHLKLDFHCIRDWQTMKFVPSLELQADQQ